MVKQGIEVLICGMMDKILIKTKYSKDLKQYINLNGSSILMVTRGIMKKETVTLSDFQDSIRKQFLNLHYLTCKIVRSE